MLRRNPNQELSKKAKDGAGFVVVIEGFSPYRKIKELLEPAGVGRDRSRWGLITRLANLDKIPGCRFELFAKGDSEHFKYQTGDVLFEGDQEMPEIGVIGIRKEVERVPRQIEESRNTLTSLNKQARTAVGRIEDRIEIEEVIIDPLTGEEMSRVIDIWNQNEIDAGLAPEGTKAGDIKFDPLTGDEKYTLHDTWFKIKAKFLWKDALEINKPLQ